MTPEINIADFAAFCRSKGDVAYGWDNPITCALGQYARHIFPDDPTACSAADGTAIFTVDKVHVLDGLPQHFVYDIDAGEYTFSALADRLDALLETVDA